MGVASNYRRSVLLAPPREPLHSLDTSQRYVEVPHLGLSLPTDSITLEFYANFTSVEANVAFCLAADASSGSNRLLAHVPDQTGLVYFDHGNASSPGGRLQTDNNALNLNPLSLAGAWHHWAFVVDAAASERRVYLDGKLLKRTTGYLPLAAIDQSFFLGWWDYAPAPHYPGRLAEFRIWSLARTEAQILARKDTPIRTARPGLLASWLLQDAPVGAQVYDYSGNNYHGITR